jgi:hypothetical protein
MKVGDLVQLSAYGRARQYNYNLTDRGRDPNIVGLVMAINQNNYPYKILWNNRPNGHEGHGHLRTELRFARKANEAG